MVDWYTFSCLLPVFCRQTFSVMLCTAVYDLVRWHYTLMRFG